MSGLFIHGPYTDTPPPEPEPAAGGRQVPRSSVSVKAVIVATLLAVFGIGCWVGSAGDDVPPARESLPVCEVAGGKTQKACIHDTGNGPRVIYMDYGRYMYDAINNQMH